MPVHGDYVRLRRFVADVLHEVPYAALDNVSFERQKVTDAAIERFGLMKRYQVEHIEFAREELWKHCYTSVARKSGVVVLSCEDRSPAIARDLGEMLRQLVRLLLGQAN